MTTRRALIAACAAPPIIVGCVLLADSLAGLGGRRLLWPDPPLSISEALLARNAGEAKALLLAAADPNQPAPARTGAPPGTPAVLSPLEAAVRSGQRPLVQMVLDHGGAIDRESGLRLACVAERLGEQQIAAWLGELAGIVVRCDEGAQ